MKPQKGKQRYVASYVERFPWLDEVLAAELVGALKESLLLKLRAALDQAAGHEQRRFCQSLSKLPADVKLRVLAETAASPPFRPARTPPWVTHDTPQDIPESEALP